MIQLFENAGYAVKLTATQSSHQNVPVKHPHQTIAHALCTMLAGANLPQKILALRIPSLLEIVQCYSSR
jgi:hypothetical protein